MPSPTRLVAIMVLAAGGLVLGATPVLAHIEPDPARVAPGKTTSVAFALTHGCGESPTVEVTFKIPKGATNVRPEPGEGWDARVEDGTVVFEGGPLDPHTPGDFTIAFRAPKRRGELVWKVVQRCEEGVQRWIEDDEGDFPAGVVAVGQRAKSHDHDH
jgi:uncharacterized protein YcnI